MADTNPQADAAIRSLINGGYGERQAREIIAGVGGEAQERGYRRGHAQALTVDRPLHRIEILTEVADLLRDAEETDAALLVDRLLEAGESRG